MSPLRKVLSRFFVPQEDNNFRGRALHVDMLSGYLVLAMLLCFSIKLIGGGTSVLGYATDISVDKLFQLTNEERVKQHLAPLTMNAELSEAAKLKAQNMFEKNYWSHYAPDGTAPWFFILKSGYHYEYAGENLAKNFMFSNGVVEAWMNSPTHRANIVRPEYTDIGFAIVNGTLNGEETTLVVQMFGKPLSADTAAAALPGQVKAAGTQEPIPTPRLPVPSITTQYNAAPAILANQSQRSPVSGLSFNVSIYFMLFLGIALAADLYFAKRYQLVSLSGKHLAHLIFLGFIIMGIFIIARGTIL